MPICDHIEQAYANSPIISSYNQVRHIFEAGLESLSNRHKHEFTMEGRKAAVLPPDDFDFPRLIQGYCERIGEFWLLAVQASKRPWVLQALAHEYGHSIPPYFPDTVLEELKAVLFEHILAEEICLDMSVESELRMVTRLFSSGKVSRKEEGHVAEKVMADIINRLENRYSWIGGDNAYVTAFNIVGYGKACNSLNREAVRNSENLIHLSDICKFNGRIYAGYGF